MERVTTVKKLSNIFYGWWIVGAGAILVMFGYGTWTYSYGAFFTPIQEEFHWSRAVTSLAYSFSRVEGGLEGLITGPLTDKFGSRFMVRVGWTMMALGFFLMHYINSFWLFILSYTVLVSLGGNSGLYMPMQTTVAKWFHKKRGMALGFLTSGGALGGSILVPITAWLITSYGWRIAVIPLAIVAGILGWGLSFVLKPHGPERYGLNVDGAKPEPVKAASSEAVSQTAETNAKVAEGLTLKEAARTPAFWMICVAFFFAQCALSAIIVHQIPFLQDMGVSPVLAASALGTLTLMSVPARLLGGWLADRWNVKLMYSIGSFVQAAGLLIFSQAINMTWVWIFVVVYGSSYGLRITLEPVIRARFFGRRSFGSVYGYINAFAVMGSFFGSFFAGWIYDTTGSYEIAFLTFAAMMSVAGIIILIIKSPLDQRLARLQVKGALGTH
jgi:OFA family oxalate/formate antiporter-like MFS transporter